MELESSDTESLAPSALFTLGDSMRALGGSGQPSEGPANPGAAALNEIRARVLGGPHTANSSGDEEGEPDDAEVDRKVHKELKELRQVDLNDEANIEKLEDPALQAHMESARLGLRRHEESLARLPRAEVLRKDYIRLMQKLTAIYRGIGEDTLMAGRAGVEKAHYQQRVLENLREGKKSHGHPAPVSAVARADPTYAPAMRLAGEGAGEVAKVYEATVHEVGCAHTEMFIVRREVEVLCDQLFILYTSCEEVRRRQREVLQLVGRGGGAPPTERLYPPSIRGEAAPAAPQPGPQ